VAEPQESSAEPGDGSATSRGRLHVTIVTGERLVYDGNALSVQAPGVMGQLGIRPYHTPMLAELQPGALTVRSPDGTEEFAVSGGFLEVLDNEVTVLADAAERAEEIDVARAEAARRRASLLVRRYRGHPNVAVAQQALRRSRARLKVARRHSARSRGRR
jgi:F-type H+-transporting ATPase subunit epsilon